jgi:hypothetical protein
VADAGEGSAGAERCNRRRGHRTGGTVPGSLCCPLGNRVRHPHPGDRRADPDRRAGERVLPVPGQSLSEVRVTVSGAKGACVGSWLLRFAQDDFTYALRDPAVDPSLCADHCRSLLSSTEPARSLNVLPYEPNIVAQAVEDRWSMPHSLCSPRASQCSPGSRLSSDSLLSPWSPLARAECPSD